MKDPMRLVERFAYQHPRFGIPNLMRYIVGGNVLLWLAGVLLRNRTLLSYISFDAAAILHGQIWRLVSFMFYPISSSMLALLSFYFYYWIGSTLEQYWGTPQFNIYFCSGWAFTVLYGFRCISSPASASRSRAITCTWPCFLPLPPCFRTCRCCCS